MTDVKWRDEIEASQEKLPDGSFPPDWDDLQHLYNLVLETKPETIVEYGSGYSTLVMYRGLEKLGRGVIHALESDPLFYHVNYQVFQPKMHFNHQKSHLETVQGKISFSPVETVGIQEIRYIYSPLISADMVYVDGPYLFGDSRAITNAHNMSPLPKTMVIDGRPAQMLFTHAHLCEFYDIDIDRKNYRSTLRLKDGRPARSSDTPGEPAAEA